MTDWLAPGELPPADFPITGTSVAQVATQLFALSRGRRMDYPHSDYLVPAVDVDFVSGSYRTYGTPPGLFDTVLVEVQIPTELGGNLWVGTRAHILGPLSTELANQDFAGRIKAIALGKSAMNSLTVGGLVPLSSASLILDNNDGGLNTLVRKQTAMNRKVRVWGVARNPRHRQMTGTQWSQLLFTGTVIGITTAGLQVTLALGDALELLDKPLMTTNFDGTAAQGGTSLQGQPLPVAVGFVDNISPVYLGQVDLGNGVLPTFQVNWGAISDVSAVRVRGVGLAKVTTTPVTGQYKVFATAGKFQTGVTPDGVVTCDVAGDATGTYGFQGSPPGVARKLVVDIAQAASSTILPDIAWANPLSVGTGNAGYYVPPQPTTLLNALIEFCQQMQMSIFGQRDGTIAGVMLDVQGDAPAFEIKDDDILEAQELPLPSSLLPRPTTIQAVYDLNHTVLSDVAPSVTGDTRTWLTQSGRKFTLTPSYAGQQGKQRTLNITSGFIDLTGSQNRVTSIKTWLEAEPKLYKVSTDRYLGQVELGLVCTFSCGWLGQGARAMRVVEWSEDLLQGIVSITLVG